MIPLMKNTFLKEDETKKALAKFILTSDTLSMGNKCFEFEKKFATWQARRYAVLFNSGGSANLALFQALKNLGRIHNDDPVAFSALTWSTNVMPIIQMGLKPIVVDCEPKILNVTSRQLLSTIKRHPIKAFFITNALGWTGDLDKIKNLCRKHKITLLEDNCESLGTVLPTGRAGNFGLASTFSFFVAHHMSTIEGGMACTDDEDLANMLKIVRANGWDRNLSTKYQDRFRKKYGIKSEYESKYSFYDLGYNLRPTEITGFLGLSQLKFLDANVKKREQNYIKAEKAIYANPDLICLRRNHITTLSPFCLPIICKTSELRDRYHKRFTDAGIEIRPMIAGNIQKQPFYKKYILEKNPIDLPGADFIHHNGFYCGNYPDLTPKELDKIISCLKP